MSVEYEGERIKQAPLTILRLLARHAESDGPNRVLVRDIIDETDLSRGSIYNYLNNTLEPLGLATVVATKPTRGSAKDAKYWRITQDGHDWLTSLTPEDLPATEASGKAVEIATEARSEARNANETISDLASDTRITIENLDEEYRDNFDALHNAINGIFGDIAEIRQQIDAVDAAAHRTDQDIARSLRPIHQRLGVVENRAWELDLILRGDPNDSSDVGLITGHRNMADDLTATESRVDTAETRALVAIVIAALALLVAIIVAVPI